MNELIKIVQAEKRIGYISSKQELLIRLPETESMENNIFFNKSEHGDKTMSEIIESLKSVSEQHIKNDTEKNVIGFMGYYIFQNDEIGIGITLIYWDKFKREKLSFPYFKKTFIDL